MSDMVTIDGEIYSADKFAGTTIWLVRWFTSRHSSVPNNILAGQVAEAEIDEPTNANWLPEAAVQAAIKQGSWA